MRWKSVLISDCLGRQSEARLIWFSYIQVKLLTIFVLTIMTKTLWTAQKETTTKVMKKNSVVLVEVAL